MVQEESCKAEQGRPLSSYQEEQQLLMHFGTLDELYFDVLSPPFQGFGGDIRNLLDIESHSSTETSKGRRFVFPSSSLEVLKKYRNRSKSPNGKRIAVPCYKTEYIQTNSSRLSADNIIQLAAEKFIESTLHRGAEFSVLMHPCAGSLLGLSAEDIKDVELVMYLLASVEKVREKQYDKASKLLDECDKLSSSKGNVVQRLVYYFTEALYEKIDRETGSATAKGLGNKQLLDTDIMMTPNPTMIAFHELLPLCHVTQFAGIQAIIERVAEARKVHIIDLNICNGSQFTILMQALQAQLEHLEITAVGNKSTSILEETGRRLENFARSLGLSFSFNIVMVADIMDLNESLFVLDDDEVVAVYAAYAFKNMIWMPDQLQSLMEVIRTIHPCVVVVTEVEATDNSPDFVNRFVEALFFYGAFFDSMDDCMKHDESNRMIAESKIFGPAIRNIVAAEGEERKVRHVSIDIWRSFFARFGMTEIELSMSSKFQAKLLLKKFTCGSSFTLDINGKSLIVGWKGTPLNSLSAWTFQ